MSVTKQNGDIIYVIKSHCKFDIITYLKIF